MASAAGPLATSRASRAATWPRGTNYGQRTTRINDFESERATNVRERRRRYYSGKTRQKRKTSHSHIPLLNPAWTLFGSLKGIPGTAGYIGLLCFQAPAWFAKTLRHGAIASIASLTRATCNHLFHTPSCDRFHDRKCIRADKRTASERSLSQFAREKHATNCNNNGYLGRDARTKPQEWIQ